MALKFEIDSPLRVNMQDSPPATEIPTRLYLVANPMICSDSYHLSSIIIYHFKSGLEQNIFC